MKKSLGLSICIVMFFALIFTTSYAMDEVMYDDFALPNNSSPNSSNWTPSGTNIFKINSSGTSWSYMYATVNTTASDAHITVNNYQSKDSLLDFDITGFSNASNFFYLDTNYNGSAYTRIKFSANTTNNNIEAYAMRQDNGQYQYIGTTAYTGINNNAWISFRVRVGNGKIQIYTKRPWVDEYVYLGGLSGSLYVREDIGSVRFYVPKLTSVSNTFKIDSFKLVKATQDKKVYADYHGYRYTREHDGQLGNWKTMYKTPYSNVENPIANFNADLIDESGKNQLAAIGNPLVGMQSYNDEDYLEYQVLTAKMGGVDGFFVEYAMPQAGLIDSDLQKLQVVAEKYNFGIGIDWINANYYAWIANNANYTAWCTTNGYDKNLDSSKLAYVQVVFQQLVDMVYSKSNAITHNGKPLMLVFGGNEDVFTHSSLATVKGYQYNYMNNSSHPNPFTFIRRAPMGLQTTGNPDVQKFWGDWSGWEKQSDGTFGWKPSMEREVPAQYTGLFDLYGDERDSKEFARAHVEGMLKTSGLKLNMAGVMPGFDNRYCASWGGYKIENIDRKNGLTYEEGWKEYLANKDMVDMFLIPTWNDHTEGSGIEPLEGYGYRELETTLKYSSQIKGQPDISEATDFSITERLFDLRKKTAYYTNLGFDVSAQKSMLDGAAIEISQGLYDEAEQKLITVSAVFGVHSNEVKKQINTFNIAGSIPVTVNTTYTYNMNDSTASALSQKYFEGTLSFDYLDSYTFDDNKNIRVISRLPISTNPVGGNMNILCDIRYGEGNNQWKNALIKVSKPNLPLNGSTNDLYFSGNAQIKNAVLTLITHEKDLKYKTYSRHYALSDIRIENAGNLTEITALPPTGTSFKVTAEYAKHSTDAAEYAPTLIVAFYKGNELVSILIKDSPAIPESTENNILQHTMQMPSDANKIKAFVWSGDNSYQPLTAKKVIE